MNKELLIETFILPQVDNNLLVESISNGGKLILEGVIQRANSKNQNGRVYPKHILEEKVNLYKNTFIKERRAFGELDHSDQSIINLKNVCLNMLDVWWNGDDLYGKMEVLDTPSGKIAKAILSAGCNLGISSRALGSVQALAEGVVEVQDDLSLIGWDFVSDPSTHGAFVKEVNRLQESKQIIIEEQDRYKNINQIINEIVCQQTGICCIN